MQTPPSILSYFKCQTNIASFSILFFNLLLLFWFCCLRSCQCWTRRAGKTEEKRCFAQWSPYVHVQATKSCKPQTGNDRRQWGNRRPANQYSESSPGLSNADGSSRQEPGYTFINIQFFKRVRNERKSTNKDQRFTFQKEGSFYEKSSI